MKQAWKAAVLAGLLALALVGCGRDGTAPQSIESSPANTAETDSPAGGSSLPSDAAELTSEDIFGETVQNLLLYASNRILIIKTDGVTLYDVSSKEVAAQRDGEIYGQMQWYAIEDGFCSIGQDACVFYDSQLQETGRVDMETLTEGVDFSGLGVGDQVSYVDLAIWAISADGGQIAYTDILTQTLYLYDRSSGIRQTLLSCSDGSDQENQGISGVSALYFDTERGQLILLCSSSSVSDAAVTSWATVGLDGTGLENHLLVDFDSERESAGFAQSILLIKGSAFSSAATVCVVDVASEEAQVFSLESVGERDCLQALSQTGSYFASAESHTTDNGFTIRIYRTSDGSLVAEQDIFCEDETLLSRAPQIFVLDDLTTAFVKLGGFYGLDLETDETVWFPSQVVRFTW